MSASEHFFSDTRKELEQYLENRILLLKMQAADQSARLIARLTVVILLGLVAFCILFSISIMAGYYFSSLTGKLELGFGIVAAIYLLVFLVFYLARHKIGKAITDRVIQVLFKNDE